MTIDKGKKTQQGLLCVQCGDDTGCTPNLAHLGREYAASLCAS